MAAVARTIREFVMRLVQFFGFLRRAFTNAIKWLRGLTDEKENTETEEDPDTD